MSAVKNLSIRLAAVGGDKVRQEFKNLGTDGDKAFRRITQVIQPANDNLKALDATARSFNEVIRQGTALFGAYLGLQGLKNTFSAIFSANTSFEQLSGSLKTVTGSAKGAQEAFSLIEKFAIDTPYQLNEIVEAFIQLKALGLEPSEAALVSYGNTASAFGKNIKDFVGAVAAATVGEFERLKTFGIKAKVINDDVSFTFAGVTTKVKKNAAEIEKYLRTLGDVNFAGAMNEQMKTMNGVLSNIEDGFEKIYRDIGKNGLNEALKSTFTQFNELVESGGSAAKTIGQTLAFAVNTASSAFFLLAEHADVALTLIGTRLGSSAILGGINLLKAGVGYLQVSMAGLSISAKSAVTGIAMMSRVSKLAAVQMGVTAASAGILKGALALIGGPAGLAVLAGMAIYKLVDSHDVAKRTAEDHAETLQKLQDELKATTEEAAKFSSEQSKDMALAEWGLKLKTAEQNIKDLRAELKNTGGLSFTTRFTPNTLLKDYEIYAKETETQNQISTLKTTGDTQVNRTQTAATEQIQLASNQADRAETAAVRAENATNNKLDIDCANINLSQVLSALGMTANNSNNYFKFPLLLANGTIRHFIFQYGITSCRIDGDTALTFPTEFPNACLTGQASFNFAFSTNSDAGCGIYNLSKTGATLRNGNNNVGNISWWVLGY